MAQSIHGVEHERDHTHSLQFLKDRAIFETYHSLIEPDAIAKVSTPESFTKSHTTLLRRRYAPRRIPVPPQNLSRPIAHLRLHPCYGASRVLTSGTKDLGRIGMPAAEIGGELSGQYLERANITGEVSHGPEVSIVT